jgi:hypothetical protein
VGVPNEIMGAAQIMDCTAAGERPEGLRLSIDDAHYADLARKRSPEIRPTEAPSRGSRLVSLAVLRRSHSTLHKQRNSDLKIIADQQGHGMRTHLDNYVQSAVAERKAEAEKLFADFKGCYTNKVVEVDYFERGL